jgi:hypothetical protein
MLKQILILRDTTTNELVEAESMNHEMLPTGRKRFKLEQRIVTTLSQIVTFGPAGNVLHREKRTPETASISHLKPVVPPKMNKTSGAYLRLAAQIREYEKKYPKTTNTRKQDQWGGDW